MIAQKTNLIFLDVFRVFVAFDVCLCQGVNTGNNTYKLEIHAYIHVVLKFHTLIYGTNTQHVRKAELSDGATLTVVVVFGCVVLGDD